MQMPARPTVQIDIISDVMCPWCLVGFRQLELALAATKLGARVRWHPFELNPDMPAEGENLADHIARKYGQTAEKSAETRRQLQDIGAAMGIRFNLTPQSRIVNSFKAHMLLDHAASVGRQHPLKLALFDAHFNAGRDVSDEDTLIEIAVEAGLDRAAAKAALQDERHAKAVRAEEQVWAESGVSGVPTIIFNERYLLTGAQGLQTYADMLTRVAAEAA